MKESTIQTQIHSAFIDAISSSTKFSPDDIKIIGEILAAGQKSDKMADLLLKAIGGSDDENT